MTIEEALELAITNADDCAAQWHKKAHAWIWMPYTDGFDKHIREVCDLRHRRDVQREVAATLRAMLELMEEEA